MQTQALGNETISNQLSYTLDSVGPTAGTVSITDIVDNGYLRSTSDVSITFSLSMIVLFIVSFSALSLYLLKRGTGIRE